jgi:hypothetical protein
MLRWLWYGSIVTGVVLAGGCEQVGSQDIFVAAMIHGGVNRDGGLRLRADGEYVELGEKQEAYFRANGRRPLRVEVGIEGETYAEKVVGPGRHGFLILPDPWVVAPDKATSSGRATSSRVPTRLLLSGQDGAPAMLPVEPLLWPTLPICVVPRFPSGLPTSRVRNQGEVLKDLRTAIQIVAGSSGERLFHLCDEASVGASAPFVNVEKKPGMTAVLV